MPYKIRKKDNDINLNYIIVLATQISQNFIQLQNLFACSTTVKYNDLPTSKACENAGRI